MASRLRIVDVMEPAILDSKLPRQLDTINARPHLKSL